MDGSKGKCLARRLDIQGHRGARALYPENTLEGFRATAALGVTAFELDVALTADGIPVATHDFALNPDIVRDPSGEWLPQRGPTIHSLTYGELSRYDVGRLRPGSRLAASFPRQQPFDGACIPSLAAILEAIPNARFTIEVKTHPAHPEWTASAQTMADATLAVIDGAGAAGRVIVEAFDWRVQRHIRRHRPDIKLAWLTSAETVRDSALWWGGATTSSVPAAVAAEGGPFWAPDFASVTKAAVQQAHALGLLVLPWTVNQPSDMRRLIDWGIDGLITDRPDLALTLTL
jgi:glycerophosphoryl diester phosphodiesterase